VRKGKDGNVTPWEWERPKGLCDYSKRTMRDLPESAGIKRERVLPLGVYNAYRRFTPPLVAKPSWRTFPCADVIGAVPDVQDVYMTGHYLSNGEVEESSVVGVLAIGGLLES
jgi:hypothetical protein